MREQFEILKDHAHALPDLPRIAIIIGAYFLAFEKHATAIECLECVGAAQQRGFSRTRRSDQADDLAAIDREADLIERLRVP